MSKNKLIGLTLAAAAVTLCTMPIMTTASAHDTHVKCFGVNSCKGHGKCKTAKNACKAHNSCKGQGYVKMSAQKCEKMHGTTEESK